MTKCLTCGETDPKPDRRCKPICCILYEGQAPASNVEIAIRVLTDFGMVEEAEKLKSRAKA